MIVIEITEGVAIIFLGLLVVGLLRSHADILRSLHELGDEGGHAFPVRVGVTSLAGESRDASGRAVDLVGESLAGEAAAVGVVGASHDTLLAFLSAGCLTCQPFWRTLSGSVKAPNGARVIVVVQYGDNVDKLRSLASDDLLVIRSDAAWSDYQVPGSPHFVYINGRSGHVSGEGTGSTWEQVVDMIVHATGTDVRKPEAPPRPSRSRDHDDAQLIDRELLDSGIAAGHPSLYPDRVASVDGLSKSP